MKIAIGNDHAGVQYKNAIIEFLKSENIEFINFGTDSSQSVDYPDFAHKVATEIQNETCDLGILICGSGNGIAMTANKHQKVRCAVCWNKEIAELAKLHNNANIISIPARFSAIEQAVEIVKTFIKTPFEQGRHSDRVKKIPCGC